jgi:hypothetical protein
LSSQLQLTTAEEAHLVFMRSEEKLARDVYLTLAAQYPAQSTFITIATQSEQTHTDTMKNTLETFNIDDPEPNADELPAAIGVFENPYFSAYFEGKYDYLTAAATTLLSALKVGALIEELDMLDINYCNDAVYEYFPLPAGTPCGLTATDVIALENTLGNLLEGSESHLCAFISQIGAISPECYTAQIIEQNEVLSIINNNCPEFAGFVCEP